MVPNPIHNARRGDLAVRRWHTRDETAIAALNRALRLIDLGNRKEAEELIIDVIRRDPRCSDAYIILADLLEQQNNWRGFIVAIEQALRLRPADAALWHRLGGIYLRMNDYDNAIEAFQQAADFQPNEPYHAINLALSYFCNTNLQEAIRLSDQLIKRHPTVAYVHVVEGHIQKALGNKSAAISAYEQALRYDSSLTDAVFNLVELQPPRLESALTEQILVLARDRRIAVNDSHKANVDFALATILANAGQFDKAFDYYCSGNRAAATWLASNGWHYDPESVEAGTNSVLSTFTKNTFNHTDDSVSSEVSLIFIVGMLRSGTTLVEQILASHQSVTAAGELPFAVECQADFTQQRSAMGRTGPVDLTDQHDEELIQTMREQYLDRMFERGIYGDIITDKMPSNYEAIGLIRLMFPDAIIINCVRDPIAICWSLYKSHLTSIHHPYANSLEHAAHYFLQFQKMMMHWYEVVPGPFLSARYEDIVLDTKCAIKRLLASCGLPWDDHCLEFYNNTRPVFTVSHQEVRQPIYSSSIAQWRHYEKHLSTLVKMFSKAGIEPRSATVELQCSPDL